MKLQNLAVVFIIIAVPLILVLGHYIGLQQETISLQTQYDEKLIASAKESIEALEINTTEWNGEYSSLVDSKRRDVLASINTFTTSLSNNLGMTGTSKEYVLNYIPAIAYGLYDGYYIYAPTYVAKTLTNENGVQMYYYKDKNKDPILVSETTREVNGQTIPGQVAYVPQDGKHDGIITVNGEDVKYTLKVENAVKTYAHSLKNYIAYSEVIDDVVVNYTLDNYIRVYSSKGNKEAEGYLVYFDKYQSRIPRIDYGAYTAIKVTEAKYNGIAIEPETLTEQISYKKTLTKGDLTGDGKINILDTVRLMRILGEKTQSSNFFVEDINSDGVLSEDDVTLLKKVVIGSVEFDKVTTEEQTLETFKYIYTSNNEKLYYDDAEDNFFRLSNGKREFLEDNDDVTVGAANCEFKSASILIADDNFMQVYQVLNGVGKGNWYTYSAESKKYTKLSEGELGFSSSQLVKDFSSINYYVESYAFTNLVNDLEISEHLIIDETNDPENSDSDFMAHKKSIMKDSINSSLDTAIQSYATYSQNYNYQLPELLETDWEQMFSNVSIVAFFQGVQTGLKYYNNYAIATSSANQEYFNPDELYYVGDDTFYHKVDCDKLADAEKVTAYRNTEFKAKSDTDAETVYFMHDDQDDNYSEQACYYCIVDRANYEESTNDTISATYEKARYVATARERYKTNVVLTEGGLGETSDITDLEDAASNFNYQLIFPDSSEYSRSGVIGHNTLQGAVNMAQGSKYSEAIGIKVVRNVDSDESTENITINKTGFTINTNGCTVQMQKSITITGSVTIQGGGVIKAKSGAGLTSIIDNSGTLTIDTVTIGNTIDSENQNNNEAVNGIENSSGTLNIIGDSNVYGKTYGILANGGTVKIGSDDESMLPEYQSIYISSGEDYGIKISGATVNFNGGYIRGLNTNPISGTINLRDGYNTIKYIDESPFTLATLSDKKMNYRVVTADAYTETLAEAIALAEDKDEIIALNNYTDSSDVPEITKTVTINTNGRVITRTKNLSIGDEGNVTISGRGTLTIASDTEFITNKGTLNIAHQGTISNTGAGRVITNTGTLNKTGAGKIESKSDFTIVVDNGTATLYNGTVSSLGSESAHAIRQSGGIVNVKGATITTAGTYASAIYSTAGEINVENGTLETPNLPEYASDTSTGYDYGAIYADGENIRIAISGGTINSKGVGVRALDGASITISNGTINSTGNTAVVSNDGSIKITGGTITSSGRNGVSADDSILAITGGKISTTASSAIWSDSDVAITGGTLQKFGANAGAAVDYAGTGTVTISGGTIEVGSDSSSNAIWNETAGTIKITGGTINHKATAQGITNNGAGKIEISGGTINVKEAIINNADGTITVTDGTITSGKYGIYNKSTGSVTVIKGTITGNTHGIYNEGTGTITIGSEDDILSVKIPNITGKTGFGVHSGNSGATFNFYNGVIKAPSKSETNLTAYDVIGTIDLRTGFEAVTNIGDGLYETTLAKTYVVTLESNGGTSTLNTKRVTYGSIYGLSVDGAESPLPTPSKTGYIFEGWYTNEGELIKDSNKVEIESDHTLYAYWEAITYEVKYNGNGATSGEMENSEHVYDVEKKLTENDYARVGYTFDSWNTSLDGSGKEYEDEASVMNLSSANGAVVTLYAQWTPNTYTVKYNANGGTGTTASSTHYYGVDRELTENGFTRTGYIFKNWNTKTDGTGTSYGNKEIVRNLTSVPGGTVNLYAQWKAITYTVKYDANGGTGTTADSSHTYDVAKTLTTNGYSRPGYMFSGWNTKQNGSGTTYKNEASVKNLTTEDKATVILYAQWVTITYTVEYDGNGATGGSTASSTHEYDIEKTLTPNGFTKTGYVFKSWNTEEDGTGNSYADGAKVKNLCSEPGGTVTLYAQWRPITYTIKYHGNGNTSGDTANSTHTYDVAKNLTANGFVKTGYTFAKWNTNSEGTGTSYTNGQSVKNLTTKDGATINLYAQWNPITYTVIYNGNGATGGSTASSTHTYDIEKNLTANGFERTGYTFASWNTAKDGTGTSYNDKELVVNLTTTPGGKVNLYAQWTPNRYTVKYNANGGTGTTADSEHIYDVEKALTANGYTRTGYLFKYWNTKADGTGTTYADKATVKNLTSEPGGTVTLYAQWKAITYTVIYNGNGATGGSTASSTHTYDIEKALTANGYTRTGYVFKNWNTTADGKGTSYEDKETVKNLSATDDGKVTLYAQWTANTYTVKYNANGGTGTTASSTHTYDVAKNLTANGFTKTGYLFKEWNTKADGTGTSYADKASVKNLTSEPGGTVNLYAQWKAITYTIVYNGNGSTGGSTASSTHTYDVEKALTANGFTKTGYIFVEWNTKADGTGTSYENKETVINLSTVQGATVNLYAQWEPLKYTIVYKGNGATGGSTASSEHTYDVEKALTANGYTKTGYTFKNWNSKADGTGTAYADKATVKNLTTTSGATVNLYAQWTAITYTVAYNGNGNTGGSTASSEHTYDIAKALTANGFTKTGYTFANWNTKSDGTGTSYADKASVKNLTATAGETITLYAQWTAIKYTVVYNGNGSTSGSTESSTHTYDIEKALTANGFKKTGYTFSNWNTKADGTGTSYANKQTVKNLASVSGATVNLYAQWTANTYTVVYNGNGATSGEMEDSVHVYDVEKTLNANTYARTGYIFSGWNTNKSGTGTSHEDKASVVNLTATANGTVTLYAKWTAITYKVKYNGNTSTSGEMADSTHTYDVAKTLTANAFKKTGYGFGGWNTKADGTGTTYADEQSVKNLTSVNGATINLYAQWEAVVYTVVYNGNGSTSGTMANSSHTYDVEKNLTANSYKRDGHTFEGWNTKEDGTGTAYADKQAVKNLTTVNGAEINLYAQWKIITYTVTYNANGGTGAPAAQTKTWGVTLVLSETEPTKTGYTFQGWATSETATTVAYQAGGNYTANEAVTLYAVWSINKYTVTYDANGGTGAPAAQEKTYGVTLVLSTTIPEKEGYDFLGWSTSSTATTATYQAGGNFTDNKNTILYAVWKIKTYTITYDANGGTGAPATQTKTHGVTLVLSETAPTRTGYTFQGWATSKTATKAAYQPKGNFTTNANTTLYAVWKINTYAVTYNANGGSGAPSAQTKTYGVDLTLSTTKPTKTGYTFSSWNTSADGKGTTYASGGTYKENAAVTLYAQWTANTYTVAYNANGGTGTTASSSHTYDTAKALTANAFTRTGYTFSKWNTKADGTGTSYADKASVKNLTSEAGATVTLYAQWTPNVITVTLNNQSATTAGSTAVYLKYNTGVYKESGCTNKMTTSANAITVPAKTGYTFGGYYTATNGGGTQLITATGYITSSFTNTYFSANATIYAKWTVNAYTVTFKHYLKDGSGSTYTLKSTTTKDINYGTEITLSSYATSVTGGNYSFASATASTSGGTAITKLTVSGDTTVGMYYTRKTYTVTYNHTGSWSDGTTGTKTQTKTYGVTLTLLSTKPTKPGYTFTKWNTNSGGTGTNYASGASYTGNANLTLYAQYSINTYTITFNHYLRNTGNTAYELNKTTTADIDYNTKITLASYKQTITGATYSFASTTASTSGGTAVTELTVTGDATVGLYYTRNTYTVKYDGNGATGGSTASSTHTYGVAKALTANGYTKTGYSFSSWNTSADGTGTKYTDKQSVTNLTATNGATITLYAQWTPNLITVTLNNQSATSAGSTAVYLKYNTGVYKESGCTNKMTTSANAITVPTRTGYTFGGYYTATNGGGTQLITATGYITSSFTTTYFSANSTIYAKWTANTYTVAYNGNGNTGGSTASSSHTYGVAKALTANGFTKTGYSFSSWNTKADGTGTTYANKASVTNLTSTNGATVTLYAQWSSNLYTITLNNQSATTAGSTAVYLKYNTGVYKESGCTNKMTTSANGITVPAKTGHTFGGYYTATSGGGTQLIAATGYITSSFTNTYFTANATIYAKWTVNKYTLTFKHYLRNTGNTAYELSTTTTQENVAYGTTITFANCKTSITGGTYSFGSLTASTSGGTAETSFTVSGTTTVGLYYVRNTYTIAYNGNGNTGGSTASSTHTYGVAKALTANGFTKTGHTFKNWNTKADGTGTSYANQASVTSLTATQGATVTLYAQWTPNVITVTLNNQSATSAGSTAVYLKYNTGVYKESGCTNKITTSANAITIPAKNGYTFGGYYTSTGGSGTQLINASGYITSSFTTTYFTANSTIYAKWTANIYKVTLDNQSATSAGTTAYWYRYNTTGTSNGSTIYYYLDESLETPMTSSTITKPTKTGYDFGGYYTATGGSGTQYVNANGVCVNNRYTVVGNVTLYAKWTLKTYTVAYNANGGTGAPSSQTKTYGVTLTLSSTKPTWTGRTFNNWNTKADGTGTSYASGASYTANAGTTLYAQWTTNTYTITVKHYLRNGANTAYELSTTTTKTGVAYGSTVTLSSYKTTITGGTYSFASLTASTSGGTAATSLTVSGATTVGLYYTRNTFTVTFNPNGGTWPDGTTANKTQTKTYGVTLTLSSTKPTRTGYDFQGWGLTTTAVSYQPGGSFTTNANTTLYAVWKSKTYTVSYNANGGSGAPSAQTKTYGVTLTLSSTKPTRTGYTFNKWNTASDGSGTSYSSGGSYTANAGTTLYAQWTVITYTVSYNANGGSGAPSSQTKTYGVTLTLSSTKPTRTGYNFLGWSTSSSATSATYSAGGSYTANSSTTLYAVWSAKPVYMYFNASGGTITTTAFTKDSSEWLYYNGSKYYCTCAGGATFDLPNYDNPDWLKMTKTGYTGVSGAEWKTSAGTTFNQVGSIAYSTLKAAATEDTDKYILNLYVNWTPNVYTITLNNQSATSAGSTAVYLKYATGVYKESGCTNKMTTSANAITKPTRTGYTFGGYYTSTGGSGTQLINANGYITSSFTTTKYSANTTIYAKWTEITYTVTLNPNGGTWSDRNNNK